MSQTSAASGGAGLNKLWLREKVDVGDGWKAAALPRMAALRVYRMRRFAEHQGDCSFFVSPTF